MTTDEIASLGHRAENMTRGLSSALERMEARPVSWAALLRGEVRAEIDFAAADRLLKECDAALKRHPDATFHGWGSDDNSLRGLTENLRTTIEGLAAFRGK